MRTQGALLSRPRSQNDRIACLALVVAVAAVLFKSLLVVAVVVVIVFAKLHNLLASIERSF
jgi:hypothetical protein